MNKWLKIVVSIGLVAGVVYYSFELLEANPSYAEANITNVAQTSTTNLTKDEAAKIAEDYSKKAVEEVEVEKKTDGSFVYQVEFIDDMDDDVYVNPEDGTLINNEQMLSNIKISEEEAQEIALKEVPGIITSFELEDEAGEYYYEIEIQENNGNEKDLEISAVTGKIVSIEND